MDKMVVKKALSATKEGLELTIDALALSCALLRGHRKAEAKRRWRDSLRSRVGFNRRMQEIADSWCILF